MNKDVSKLETIIGKIENLQNTTKNLTLKDYCSKAKRELLNALRAVDNGE